MFAQRKTRRHRGGRKQRRSSMRRSHSSIPPLFQPNASANLALPTQQQVSSNPTAQHRSSCSAASGSNGDVNQQAMNPLVAKLLRGESLPSQQQRSPILERIFNTAKGPEYYREQIEICVANPGRFLASWTLLVTLFGEPPLYDYVRQCGWTENDLKQFVIKEEELQAYSD